MGTPIFLLTRQYGNVDDMEFANLTITTLSAREFNRNVGRAKRATAAGPVIITDRGRPSYVLLSIEDYRKLRGRRRMSLLEALTPSHPEPMDDDFEVPKLGNITKPIDLG